jgi:putative hydrolase of the HAD superfamily
MPKAILFDADGVVLKKHHGEYFSVRFSREHDAPVEEVTEFFKTKFRLCQEGKADLKQELNPVLPKWGWDKDVDAFLEYWFTSDVEVDPEVIQAVQKYRKQGIKCYLATDQEKYRAAYLRDIMGLAQKFDGFFFSCELGAVKSQSSFFEQVLIRLDLQPTEIAYWDDEKRNVEVAKALGINAKFYESIADLTI